MGTNSLFYPAGVGGNKTIPGRFLSFGGNSSSRAGDGFVLALVVMAQGYSHCIGSIHKARVFFKLQGMLQHLPYLLFGGVAPAGNGLLDFAGGVLYGVQSVHHAGGDSHTLRAPQFQHTLHVFAKEGGFDSYSHRAVVFYQAFHLLEDKFQPFCMILMLSQLQYPHFHQRNTIFAHGNQSVAHNKRSGVYTQYNIRGGFQYTNDDLNKSTKIWLNYLLGGSISLLLLWGIYLQVLRQLNKVDWDAIWQTGHEYFLWLCIILMPINLLLEAKKWQILAGSAQPLSYRGAMASYLGGIAFSLVTPNRLGEYPGRLLYLKRKNTLRLVSVSVLGALTQMLTLFVFGTIGLVYFNLNFYHPFALVLLVIAAMITIILGIAFWRFETWLPFIEKIKWLRRFRVYKSLLKRFSQKQQLTILTISLLRYSIYTAQYLFLLYYMNVDMPAFDGYWMSALFFWVITVIPSITLVELGERGQVGLYLFHHFSDNTVGILVATVGIWLINLVLPAILGSILLLRMRFLR